MKYRKITAVLLAGAMAASVALSGCGNEIDENATVATYGDRTITAGYAGFVTHFNQASYDDMLIGYYGQGYWDNEQLAGEDGKTMAQTVKDYLVDEMELGYLLEDHMAEFGVEVTDEDKAAMAAAAETFLADNSKKAIKSLGATQEYIEQMLYYNTITARMENAIKAAAEINISDNEVARRTISYIRIDLTGSTDEEGNTIEYTDEQKAELKNTAELIASVATEDMETVAQSYNFEVKSYSYGQDDEVMDAAVLAAADELEEGQVSGVIETADSYYIVRLDSANDEEASESARRSAEMQQREDYYNEVTEGYKADSVFELNEEEWEKIGFSGQYTFVADDEEAPAEE